MSHQVMSFGGYLINLAAVEKSKRKKKHILPTLPTQFFEKKEIFSILFLYFPPPYASTVMELMGREGR